MGGWLLWSDAVGDDFCLLYFSGRGRRRRRYLSLPVVPTTVHLCMYVRTYIWNLLNLKIDSSSSASVLCCLEEKTRQVHKVGKAYIWVKRKKEKGHRSRKEGGEENEIHPADLVSLLLLLLFFRRRHLHLLRWNRDGNMFLFLFPLVAHCSSFLAWFLLLPHSVRLSDCSMLFPWPTKYVGTYIRQPESSREYMCVRWDPFNPRHV